MPDCNHAIVYPGTDVCPLCEARDRLAQTEKEREELKARVPPSMAGAIGRATSSLQASLAATKVEVEQAEAKYDIVMRLLRSNQDCRHMGGKPLIDTVAMRMAGMTSGEVALVIATVAVST